MAESNRLVMEIINANTPVLAINDDMGVCKHYPE